MDTDRWRDLGKGDRVWAQSSRCQSLCPCSCSNNKWLRWRIWRNEVSPVFLQVTSVLVLSVSLWSENWWHSLVCGNNNYCIWWSVYAFPFPFEMCKITCSPTGGDTNRETDTLQCTRAATRMQFMHQSAAADMLNTFSIYSVCEIIWQNVKVWHKLLDNMCRVKTNSRPNDRHTPGQRLAVQCNPMAGD